MNWYQIVLGFAVSVIGGHFVVKQVVVKCLWPYAGKKHGYDWQSQKAYLTPLLGVVERSLYTGALIVGGLHGGAWQAVGGLLAIKVAVRWQRSKDEKQLRDSDNIWLIGTGLSVLFGFIGAWIALGHPPVIGKP
jgi:hypothetical protein